MPNVGRNGFAPSFVVIVLAIALGLLWWLRPAEPAFGAGAQLGRFRLLVGDAPQSNVLVRVGRSDHTVRTDGEGWIQVHVTEQPLQLTAGRHVDGSWQPTGERWLASLAAIGKALTAER